MASPALTPSIPSPARKPLRSTFQRLRALVRLRHRRHHGRSGARLAATAPSPSHFGLPVDPGGRGRRHFRRSRTTPRRAKLINSEFLNGIGCQGGDRVACSCEIEQARHSGRKRQVNYRLRDAIFSRQRYWGEPFPVYYKERRSAYPLSRGQKLPLATAARSPTSAPAAQRRTAAGPRQGVGARPKAGPTNLRTMPGFAGSSAYYLRYMDHAQRPGARFRPGGRRLLAAAWTSTSAASSTPPGHLMYSRFWNKFLYDLGAVCDGRAVPASSSIRA